MRLIFDFNSLAMREVYSSCRDGVPLEQAVIEAMADHVLEQQKLFGKADSIIVALEGGKCWRRTLYPNYKAGRHEKRAADTTVDWQEAFRRLGGLCNVLAASVPWNFVRVEGCEADDVVYVASKEYDGDVTIISSDSDYKQLCSGSVTQLMIHKGQFMSWPQRELFGSSFMELNNPEEWLCAAILTGQHMKDGVYNVLTDSDWDGKRRPPFGYRRLKQVFDAANGYSKEEPLRDRVHKVLGLLFDEHAQMNFRRNEKLIDMSRLPDSLYSEISEKLAEMPVSLDTDILMHLSEPDWWSCPQMMYNVISKLERCCYVRE